MHRTHVTEHKVDCLNCYFVEKAHGVHNPGYASALLMKAYEDLKGALEEAEKTLEPL